MPQEPVDAEVHFKHNLFDEGRGTSIEEESSSYAGAFFLGIVLVETRLIAFLL
jgi:hypothetical protein